MAHALSPGYLKLVEDAQQRVPSFTIEEFLARLQTGERYILIDVREESEWTRGHLPGAHHLGRGTIEREIEQAIPDKNAPIVLYCDGDHRSTLAADSLQSLGYTVVVALEGGWSTWMERGLPVVLPEFVP
jgi:rhodanese-related sulfurtransferase